MMARRDEMALRDFDHSVHLSHSTTNDIFGQDQHLGCQ